MKKFLRTGNPNNGKGHPKITLIPWPRMEEVEKVILVPRI